MHSRSPNRRAGDAALEKAFAIFQRIARDRGHTKLAALASDLALPRSTLYRITCALEYGGLITRVAPGCYSVGVPLMEALHGVSFSGQLVEICRPALVKLAQSCHATAHLGVMENAMVTYLVKAPATGGMAASFTRENSQLEAYCSAIGKVLLAWLPEPELEHYLADGRFVPLTKRTITDPQVLRASLKAIKTERCARDDGEIEDDLYCLAAPLWAAPLPMTAAVSLSFSRHRRAAGDDEILLAKLRHCAAELALKIGKSAAPDDRSRAMTGRVR